MGRLAGKIANVVARHGRLDSLVNNAGVVQPGAIGMAQMEREEAA